MEWSLGRLKFLLCGIAVGLGLVHTWLGLAAVHGMDGVSYLDMGDAYMRSDWDTAINGLWNPLYAVMAGAALHVVKPSPRWEFPFIHLLGFAIYIVALICFDFLWAELAEVRRKEERSSTGEASAGFPDWAWLLIGYCLFLWVSLHVIRVVEESPDMLVAALVYLASALMLRISTGGARTGTFILLGLVLGVGYLAKAVMFPLSFVFLVVAAFVVLRQKQALVRPLVAFVVFLVMASPLILALSRTKGRLTFSDSGKINYLWHVDGVPWMYWQGNFPGSGAPTHPPRQILTNPVIFEFAKPFAATYPPWYDPSYWYDGMKPHFNLKKEMGALSEAAATYYSLFFRPGAALIAISLTLLFLGRSFRDLARRLDLLIPTVAGMGMYALIHVEPRYVGSFILVFWGAVLCQLRLPDSYHSRRLFVCATLSIVIIYSAALAFGTLSAAASEGVLSARYQANFKVAESIRWAGLGSADPVASIGSHTGTTWARLARVRIVADMPDGADFWLEGPDAQSKVLSAFQTSGAKAVVAEATSQPVSMDGWSRVGKTNFYLYIFRK